MPRTKVARRKRRFEALESRLCMAAEVKLLEGGLLAIAGDATGAIDITISDVAGVQTVVVAEAGVEPPASFPLADVSGGVRIRLTGDGAGANDTVNMNLGGQTLDSVFADLGRGDNSFALANGTIAKTLTVRGGDGNDSVSIAADAAVNGLFTALLGNGTNSVDILGHTGSVVIRGGSGDDTVTLGDDAVVARLAASLGPGGNTFNSAGDITGGAVIDGGSGSDRIAISGNTGGLVAALGGGTNDVAISGKASGPVIVNTRDGNDTVTLAEGAEIGGQFITNLGGGDNSLTLAGHVSRGVTYNGLGGNDVVSIGGTGSIGGQVIAQLGGGNNSLTQAGLIAGNLVVFSTNAADADRIVTKDGTVNGQTLIRVGRPKLRDLFDQIFHAIFG